MANTTEKFDEQVSLLLIGDSAVGKTSLLLRYACDKFSPSFITTIGIDYRTKNIELDGRKIRTILWDTAGQERFRSIAVSYFRGAHCILLVYDVTDRGSFENVSNWMSQIEQHAQPNVACVLIGNKTDCDNVIISKEEGDALADRHGIKHFRCSAKSGENVDASFHHVTKQYLGRRPGAGSNSTSTVSTAHKNIPMQDPVKLTAVDKEKKTSCCGGGGMASMTSPTG